MKNFPYTGLPPFQYWSTRGDIAAGDGIGPQGSAKFRFENSTIFGSAGSCFARRIREQLQSDGLDYYVAESGPHWLSDDERRSYNYGTHSARFGDIFTSLQLLQLLKRAVGRFEPVEDVWYSEGDEVFDPFRPEIQPSGFTSAAELRRDRERHLRAVVRMFETIDVFLFTLGMTEVWCNRLDGAALPLCPGRSGRGTFDANRYVLRNLDVTENVANLKEFLDIAREINPRLCVVFTVSPVPLVATLEPPHIFRSTVYSKSVLRVAAETVTRADPAADYFASYEIALACGYRPPFFEDDGRTVSKHGVSTVMKAFYHHYLKREPQKPPEIRPSDSVDQGEPLCDEDLLLEAIEQDFSR